MREHELRIPYRSRDAPLDVEAVDLPRALDDRQERAVAQHLIWEAMTDPGMSTVGDLLDRIEEASPEARRRIADEARAACGLPTFTEIERRQESARTQRWPPPAPSGRSLDADELSSEQIPIDPATGLPAMRPEAAEHYRREYQRAEDAGQRRRREREAELERLAKLEAEYRATLTPPAGFRPPRTRP